MKKKVKDFLKDNKSSIDNKPFMVRFSVFQISMLLLILIVSSYFMFSEVLNFWNSLPNIKDKQVSEVSEKNNNVQTRNDAPKISTNYSLTNNMKVKNYFFLNGEELVAFRSEKGNILHLELKEGINQSKFNTLEFIATPPEPIEVKLERPNFITIKFTGEFEPSLEFSYISINDGPAEVYKVSYYKYSEEMLPKDKNYSPIYNPDDF